MAQKTKLKKHLYRVLNAIANSETIDLEPKTLYNARVALKDMGLIRNISRGKYQII